MGTAYEATAEVMVRMLSAFKERGKQLNLIKNLAMLKPRRFRNRKRRKEKLWLMFLALESLRETKFMLSICHWICYQAKQFQWSLKACQKTAGCMYCVLIEFIYTGEIEAFGIFQSPEKYFYICTF